MAVKRVSEVKPANVERGSESATPTSFRYFSAPEKAAGGRQVNRNNIRTCTDASRLCPQVSTLYHPTLSA